MTEMVLKNCDRILEKIVPRLPRFLALIAAVEDLALGIREISFGLDFTIASISPRESTSTLQRD